MPQPAHALYPEKLNLLDEALRMSRRVMADTLSIPHATIDQALAPVEEMRKAWEAECCAEAGVPSHTRSPLETWLGRVVPASVPDVGVEWVKSKKAWSVFNPKNPLRPRIDLVPELVLVGANVYSNERRFWLRGLWVPDVLVASVKPHCKRLLLSKAPALTEGRRPVKSAVAVWLSPSGEVWFAEPAERVRMHAEEGVGFGPSDSRRVWSEGEKLMLREAVRAGQSYEMLGIRYGVSAHRIYELTLEAQGLGDHEAQ